MLTEFMVCLAILLIIFILRFAVSSVILNIFDKKGEFKMNGNFANSYQKEAHKFADYVIPQIGNDKIDYVYPSLGLSEEAGEVAGKYAKAVRDCNGQIDSERKEAIIKELGDVCWFVAELSTLLNVSLADVMQGNLNKLESRRARGKIHGSGDDR